MIGIIADTWGLSFRRVAFLTEIGMKKLGYATRIYEMRTPTIVFGKILRGIIIGDTALSLRMHIHETWAPFMEQRVWWTDTPLEYQGIVTQGMIDFINDNYRVAAVSEYNAKQYKEIGIHVHGLIPRPIDLEAIVNVMKHERGKWRKRLGGDYIITVGSDNIILRDRYPRKGLDLYDAAIGMIKNQLKKMGIKTVAVTNWKLDNVDYLIPAGSLSDTDIYAIIGDAKLFVWCSRREGFGMPPLEAMALRVPVVFTDAPAHNEFLIGYKVEARAILDVIHRESGLPMTVYDFSAKEIADTILYALDEIKKGFHVEIVGRAFERAKYFDVRNVAQMLIEI